MTSSFKWEENIWSHTCLPVFIIFCVNRILTWQCRKWHHTVVTIVAIFSLCSYVGFEWLNGTELDYFSLPNYNLSLPIWTVIPPYFRYCNNYELVVMVTNTKLQLWEYHVVQLKDRFIFHIYIQTIALFVSLGVCLFFFQFTLVTIKGSQ